MLPRFFFIIVIYLFFFWVQFVIIFPVETKFNEFAGIVSLIYLPHAVRIISFFVIGSIAFIPIYIGINAILPMTKKDIIRTAWGKYIKLTIPANSLNLVSTGNIITNWTQKKNKYITIIKKNLGNIMNSYI